MEKAAECAKETNDMSLMVDYIKRASAAYREAGRPQAAADCLTKGARWSEVNDADVSHRGLAATTDQLYLPSQDICSVRAKVILDGAGTSWSNWDLDII